MKLAFNPPRTSQQPDELQPILCPTCGSNRVCVFTFVTGMSFVNVNTGEVIEQPDDADCSITDARSEPHRFCRNCDYEWEESK